MQMWMSSKIKWYFSCPNMHLWSTVHEHPINILRKVANRQTDERRVKHSLTSLEEVSMCWRYLGKKAKEKCTDNTDLPLIKQAIKPQQLQLFHAAVCVFL